MADVTTRWGIPYPEGADDFAVHEDIQAVAEACDAFAKDITQGTSLPGSGDDGHYFWKTDTGVLYRHDGATWQAINPKDAAAGTASLRSLGSTSTTAAAGDDARLSDSRAPNGAASGHLTGTYPSPSIAAGVVAGSHIADSVKPSGGATDATEALRALGYTAGKAAPGLPGVQIFAASGTISATGSRLVYFTGSSGQTLTLPTGAVGLSFEIHNVDSADSVTIARPGSDAINGATTLVIPAGYSAIISFAAALTWYARILPNGSGAPAALVDASVTAAKLGLVAAGRMTLSTFQDVVTDPSINNFVLLNAGWTQNIETNSAYVDVDVANSKIIAVVAGYYEVSGQVLYGSGGAAGLRGGAIFKSGSEIVRAHGSDADVYESAQIPPFIVAATAAQYFDLRFQNASGSTVRVSENPAATWLQVKYLGPSS